jgi:hypothetical protein
LRKLIVCAALLCAAAAGASGQEAATKEGGLPSFVRLGDAGAEAARLLKSDDKKERAWGAYLVGLHGLKGQTPALVLILQDESLASGGPEEAPVRQAALDALIRLDAEVPAETLLPLYQSSPDEVVILLARSPVRNQRALLTLFADDERPARWLAVGNLLAETRAPGFAPRLLGALKLTANVNVFDWEGDHNLGGGSGWNGGGGCGHGGGLDETLPPVGYYELVEYVARGVIVLARGPRVVYYTRSPHRSPCPPDVELLDRDTARVEYLAELLGTSRQWLDFDSSTWHDVVCKDESQCRAKLAAVREEVKNSYSALLGRLLEAGLLDAAEAGGLNPDITLMLTDCRAKKSFPLPAKLRGVKVTIEETGAVSPACADELPAPESDEGAP